MEEDERREENQEETEIKPPKKKSRQSRTESKQLNEERRKSYFLEPWRIIFDEFLIDSFRYRTREYNYFLLSHFHSDHYEGITKKWSHGIIIGTEITLKCLSRQYQTPSKYLHVIELNTPMYVIGKNDVEYSITAIDAGHAPGSCCFLIERLSDHQRHLHVGDFRFDKNIQKDIGWNTFVKGKEIHTLYLDTTYAKAEYQFPSREAVCSEIAAMVSKEKKKTLFVVCSYKIGKEMVAEEIARKCNLKIKVTEEKWEYIKMCDRDLSLYTLTDSNLELRNKNNTAFHLQEQLVDYGGYFDKIIRIEATGWTKKTQCRGVFNLKEYSFPYSEHSNFNELVECYRFVKPLHLIPTVGVEGLSTQQIVDSIIKQSKPKKGSLDAFLAKAKK